LQSGVLGCYNEAVTEKAVQKTLKNAAWFEQRLNAHYGLRIYDSNVYDTDLTGALIATLLSQHTSDLNSGRAYASLKAAFPNGWSQVREAEPEEIANAIRCGGLANIKALRIKNLLNEICERVGGSDLEILRTMDDAQGMAFLTSFHGIGSKTAACVLMFNLGRSVIPVDTHVHRVSKRLGLIGAKIDAGRAQEILLELIGKENAYSFHVHLIEHGRKICHARKPSCAACPLSERCAFYYEQQQ